MRNPEFAELAGIRSALVSIIRDLRMLEDRIAALEFVAGSEDTIEVEDEDFPVGPPIDDRDSHNTAATKQGLEDWRVLNKVLVDQEIIEELEGDQKNA
jgi:hypothetical protein